MGFWHTGYEDFHQPSGFGNEHDNRKTVYPCHYCKTEFDTTALLQRHRFEAHPTSVPTLSIDEYELGTTTHRITYATQPANFIIHRATVARLNDRTIPLASVATTLASIQNDRVSIELGNDGALAVFDVIFCVAKLSDLTGIEDAFMLLADERDLSISKIDAFIEACAAFTTAAGYREGICQYLYGILAKEGADDCSIPRSLYTDRLSSAVASLSDYDRPLARTIRALVAFHFNHFDDVIQLTTEGRLQNVARGFQWALAGEALLVGTSGTYSPTRLENILVDHDTMQILWWTQLLPEERTQNIENLVQLLSSNITAFDRLKVKMLLAEESFKVGDIVRAGTIAREFVGQVKTTAWAAHLIARVAREKINL